jgi:hypothetical protein
MAAGDAGPATWVRVGANYLVPFMVSSVGFLSACRVPLSGEESVRGAGEDR